MRIYLSAYDNDIEVPIDDPDCINSALVTIDLEDKSVSFHQSVTFYAAHQWLFEERLTIDGIVPFGMSIAIYDINIRAFRSGWTILGISNKR